MAVAFARISWWLWGGKDKEPTASIGSSLNSSSDLGLGFREPDNVKFTSVKGGKMASASRRIKKKWQSREERRFDGEYDIVLVPSDGGCLSGSESDDSDWSIGWSEPHAPDFQSDDETENSFASDGGCLSGSESDDSDWSIGWSEPHAPDFQSDDETENSFAVLVPCYRDGHKELRENSKNQLSSALGNLPNEYSAEILEDHPLPQQQHLVANSTANTQTSVNMAAASTMSTATSNYNHASDGNCGGLSNLNSDDKTRSVTKQMPRKRSVKKDRHSKIYTAQGPRDRRLSLDIARKFFDLQDMLGFDEASRTVEWLLTKSKAASKELKSVPQIKHNCTGGTKSSSSTSECEVESGVEETFNNGDHKPGTGSRGKSLVGLAKEKSTKQSRRPLARESRANARARARERTREKNCSRALDESKQCFDANHHNLNQLWSSSPLVETGEESGSLSYNMNSSLEVVAEVEEPSSRSLEHQAPIQDIVDDSFVMTKKPSPSSIFNYQQNIVFSQESQFAELHELYAKPWEAYNNQSPC